MVPQECFDNLPELLLFSDLDAENLKPHFSLLHCPYPYGVDHNLRIPIPLIEPEAQDLTRAGQDIGAR